MKGKYKLELNFVGDGKLFLNYWDSIHGNDVVAEIIDNKLFMGEGEEEEEITFAEYLNRVKKTLEKQAE